VIDTGPGFDYDPVRIADLWAESGRGLFLVSALSNGIAIERLPGYGSHIKVKLPVTLERSTEAALVSSTSDPPV
jgi:hypothetical protein